MEVRTSALMETIAKKLFGISQCPKKEQDKMVVRACKAGQAYHTAQLKSLRDKVVELFNDTTDSDSLTDNLLRRDVLSLIDDMMKEERK